jgi:hypothetical protein
VDDNWFDYITNLTKKTWNLMKEKKEKKSPPSYRIEKLEL